MQDDIRRLQRLFPTIIAFPVIEVAVEAGKVTAADLQTQRVPG